MGPCCRESGFGLRQNGGSGLDLMTFPGNRFTNAFKLALEILGKLQRRGKLVYTSVNRAVLNHPSYLLKFDFFSGNLRRPGPVVNLNWTDARAPRTNGLLSGTSDLITGPDGERR